MVSAKRISTWRLLAVGVLLSVIGSAHGAGANLIVNPGLESQKLFDWKYGSCATAKRVQVMPHSGRWCLYVKDESDSVGQGNNRRFAVRPGKYYAEAWARIDPANPGGLVSLDVQFFDANGRYTGRSLVGQTDSREWTRLSAIVVVPETASFRIKPTGPSPEVPRDKVGSLRGACFADDFYFAPFRKANEEGRLTAPSRRTSAGATLYLRLP